VIDLGPDGGHRGGQIIAEGTPEDIAAMPQSHTGRFLAKALGTPSKPARRTSPKKASAA
jgi:excinuclease ABC subunit A